MYSVWSFSDYSVYDIRWTEFVVITHGSAHEQNTSSDHSFGDLCTLDTFCFSVPVSSWEHREAQNDSHKTRRNCVCLFFLSPVCSNQFIFTFCSTDLQFSIKRWLCLGVEPPAGPPKLLGEEHTVLSSRGNVSNLQILTLLLQYTWDHRWYYKLVTQRKLMTNLSLQSVMNFPCFFLPSFQCTVLAALKTEWLSEWCMSHARAHKHTHTHTQSFFLFYLFIYLFIYFFFLFFLRF